MSIKETIEKLRDLRFDMSPIKFHKCIDPEHFLRKIVSHYSELSEIIEALEQFVQANYSEEGMAQNPNVYIFNDSDGGFEKCPCDRCPNNSDKPYIIDGTISSDISNATIYILPEENGIEKLNEYVNKIFWEKE